MLSRLGECGVPVMGHRHSVGMFYATSDATTVRDADFHMVWHYCVDNVLPVRGRRVKVETQDLTVLQASLPCIPSW